ncbi:MAG: outer membrane beta-barrel protein, partial [Candidatus Aminicenantales bacterium]
MNKIWKTLAIGAVVAMLVLPRMAAADVKFGIKGGVNVANVNGNFADNVTNWKSRVGFCAGIFLEFNLGRILTIQPEVLYTM